MFDRVLNTSLYLHIHANNMHNRQGICTGSVSIIILFSFSRNKEILISYKNFKLGKNKVTKRSFDPNFPLDVNQLLLQIGYKSGMFRYVWGKWKSVIIAPLKIW